MAQRYKIYINRPPVRTPLRGHPTSQQRHTDPQRGRPASQSTQSENEQQPAAVPLILTDDLRVARVKPEGGEAPKETMVINWDRSNRAMKDIIRQLERAADIEQAVIYAEQIEPLRETVFTHFTFVEAAGGIVRNARKEVLMIYRNGRWDLPKGKCEEHEQPEITAVREVQEETGLTEVQLEQSLCNTYHTYHREDKRVLKRTHWYLMHADASADALQPQEAEGITLVRWFGRQALVHPYQQTFDNIRDVLERAKEVT